MDSARRPSGLKPPSRLVKPTAGLSKQNGDHVQHPCCTQAQVAETPKKVPETPRKGSDASVLTTDTASFHVGERVWVSGMKPGRIMYIGETQFAPGEWAGIVLDAADGKNNGSVAGVRYFTCEPNRGIFSRLTKLSRTPLSGVAESEPPREGASVPGSRRSSIAMGVRSANSSSVKSPTDASASAASPGEELELGDKVIVSSSSGSKTGFLRYLGKTDFADGHWAGVELETPSGKNDGSVAGKRYFSCRPNYGLFAPAHKISKPARRTSQKMGVQSLRRSTSRESLCSVTSHASRVSTARAAAATPRMRAANAAAASPNHALQKVLKEKEEHIEQLLRERDMERSEVVRAASLVDDSEVRQLEMQREHQQQLAESASALERLESRVAELEAERNQLQHAAEDERHRAEELQFSVEEAGITRAELESRLATMEAEATQKAEELQAALSKAELAILQEAAGGDAAHDWRPDHLSQLEKLRTEMTAGKEETEKLRSTLAEKDRSLEKCSAEIALKERAGTGGARGGGVTEERTGGAAAALRGASCRRRLEGRRSSQAGHRRCSAQGLPRPGREGEVFCSC